MVVSAKKVLYCITKSNWGQNKNCFLFCPVLRQRPLLSKAKQVVGGPAQFYFV